MYVSIIYTQEVSILLILKKEQVEVGAFDACVDALSSVLICEYMIWWLIHVVHRCVFIENTNSALRWVMELNQPQY